MLKETGRLIEKKEHAISHATVWGRKLLLTGLIMASAAIGADAITHISPPSNRRNVDIKKECKTNLSYQPLEKVLAKTPVIELAISEKDILIVFMDDWGSRLSFGEFKEATEQLKGATGLIRIFLWRVPSGTNRRVEAKFKKGGYVEMFIERKNLGKLLDYTKKNFDYKEGIKVFNSGKCEKPLSFTYPKECEDYVKYQARELYKLPFVMAACGFKHRINLDIGPSEMQRFQALATAIVRSECGDGDVTSEKAASAINKWITSNIIYVGANKEYVGKLRSFYSALDVMRHGTGVCFDFSNLMAVMCNSIGIPARTTWIGTTSTHKFVGGGFHTVVEVNLAGEWANVFDPTNRYRGNDEYYTHETYLHIFPLIGEGDTSGAVFTPSRPIKQ